MPWAQPKGDMDPARRHWRGQDAGRYGLVRTAREGGDGRSIRAPVPRHRVTDLNVLPVAVDLGSYHAEVLSWDFIEPRVWRNYLHTHSFFEICVAFAGRGTFHMLGADYPVQAGDRFVAKPGEPHEIVSSTDNPLGIYFWSYTLLRRPDSADAPAVQSTTAVDVLLDAFLTTRQWMSTQAPAVEPTLVLLTEEIGQHSPGYAQAIRGLVTKLLLDTARAVVDATLSEPLDPLAHGTSAAVVQSIMRYRRDNYARPLTVRDVAAQVHLSERHTSRLFQAALGVSIVDYLTSLRVETAAQRLLERHLTIKEVARVSGYPDLHYFTTLFRSYTGVTPAVFRRGGGTRHAAPLDRDAE